EAALSRVVRRCAGRPEHYAVMLKIPTDGGNPGPYNGRSYDGLYLLKGGSKQVWKLFPRITKDWRKPQGVHSEPWTYSPSPSWLHWGVRSVAASTRFKAEIEVRLIISLPRIPGPHRVRKLKCGLPFLPPPRVVQKSRGAIDLRGLVAGIGQHVHG